LEEDLSLVEEKVPLTCLLLRRMKFYTVTKKTRGKNFELRGEESYDCSGTEK
jgi:hypothetical protein